MFLSRVSLIFKIIFQFFEDILFFNHYPGRQEQPFFFQVYFSSFHVRNYVDFSRTRFHFHVWDLTEIFTHGIGSFTGSLWDIFTEGSKFSRTENGKISRKGFFFARKKTLFLHGKKTLFRSTHSSLNLTTTPHYVLMSSLPTYLPLKKVSLNSLKIGSCKVQRK